MPKEKMLLITSVPPFPTTSGGATRIYHTLACLSRRYELHLLTFGPPPTDPKQQEFLRAHCASVGYFPLRRRTFFSRLPRFFSCWFSSELCETVATLSRGGDFNRVRIEFTPLLYLADVLPASVKSIFVAHEISSVSFKRRISETSPGLSRILARLNAWQVRAYERRYLRRFTHIIAVSNTDKNILQNQFGLQGVKVEPNGIAAIDFLPHPPPLGELKIGFIGSRLHPPNAAALDLLVDEIMPRLREHISCRLLIAGSDNDIYQGQGIQNLGIVESERDFFRQIDVLAAPLQSGSGSRMKILGALSFGVPVITTIIGAEGLDIVSPYLQIIDPPTRLALINDTVDGLVQLGQNYPSQSELPELAAQLAPVTWEKIFKES